MDVINDILCSLTMEHGVYQGMSKYRNEGEEFEDTLTKFKDCLDWDKFKDDYEE